MGEAVVVQFARMCAACEHGFHDRCWHYLGELLGLDYVPCTCLPTCRDEYGELTESALREMMRLHPDVVIHRIKTREGIRRGSLPVHLDRGAMQPEGLVP